MSLRNRIIVGIVAAAVGIATPFIAKHEGLKTSAYYDPVGIPTICYGSTSGVKIGDFKNKAECDQLLSKEVTHFATEVNTHIIIPVKPNVLAAFTSFAYNVGLTNFRHSTALKRLNNGDIAGSCEAIATKEIDTNGKCQGYGCGWSKGKRLPGLVKRRNEEKNLCLQ